METVYIGIGSNLGEREKYIDNAIDMISKSKGITLSKISSINETEPEGYLNQPKFLNCVIEAKTNLTPLKLLQRLKDIEDKLGRVRTQRWGSRTIDLDILFYGRHIIKEPNLEIPHPLIAERKFVLEPLAELILNFIHPLLGKSIKELKEELLFSIK